VSVDPDSYGEMHLHRLADEVVERLLSGRDAEGPVPAPLSAVASLLEAAGSPANAAEIAAKASIVSAAAAEVRSQSTRAFTSPRRKPVLAKILSAKAAAAATVVALGVGTAAAAATHSLPMQADHSGPPAKHGNAPASPAPGVPRSGPTPPTGQAPAAVTNTNAQFGLCTAFLAAVPPSGAAGSGGPTGTTEPPHFASPVFSGLIQSHGSVAGTVTYCQRVVATPPTGSSESAGTPAGSTGRPSPTGQPADAQPVSTGKPADTPPVSTGKPADTPPVSTGKPADTPPVSTGKPADTPPVSTGRPAGGPSAATPRGV
jgi:hypothetical protein